MPLIDLARTKKEAKTTSVATPAYDEQTYPYGLGVTLDKSTLKKLGKPASSFKVGSTMKMICEVEVTGVSVSAHRDREATESINLQITKMDISGGKKSAYQDFVEESQKIGGVIKA